MGRLLLLANTRQENTKRINLLIKDIQRNVFEGVGKPEPLKNNQSGWWSRRIDELNRLIYKEKDGAIIIGSCRGHYSDK